MLRGIHSDTVLAEPHPQPLAGLRPTSDDIRRAAQRIAGQVEVTPFLHSRTLSRIAQAEVWLKFENLQFTASFKERGALNRLSTLSAQERSRGVIAMSAGNHAQGVAFHAQRMGIPAVIVMPRFAPSVKVERTRGFDAEVILAGDTFDDARVEAEQLVQSRGLTMVHPYDDVDVIAGQGTVGAEMLAAQPDLQCLCVAVGGGGLISGVAIAARSVRPDIEVIGVQTDRFPAMYAAVKGVASAFDEKKVETKTLHDLGVDQTIQRTLEPLTQTLRVVQQPVKREQRRIEGDAAEVGKILARRLDAGRGYRGQIPGGADHRHRAPAR